MSEHELRSLTCQECSGSWGVVLPRGFTDEAVAQARSVLDDEAAEQWAQRWADSKAEDWPDEPPPRPTCEGRLAEVVFVSEANARFLEQSTGCDELGGYPPVWVEMNDYGAPPAWWCRPRARTALVPVWGCYCSDGPPSPDNVYEELLDGGVAL